MSEGRHEPAQEAINSVAHDEWQSPEETSPEKQAALEVLTEMSEEQYETLTQELWSVIERNVSGLSATKQEEFKTHIRHVDLISQDLVDKNQDVFTDLKASRRMMRLCVLLHDIDKTPEFGNVSQHAYEAARDARTILREALQKAIPDDYEKLSETLGNYVPKVVETHSAIPYIQDNLVSGLTLLETGISKRSEDKASSLMNAVELDTSKPIISPENEQELISQGMSQENMLKLKARLTEWRNVKGFHEEGFFAGSLARQKLGRLLNEHGIQDDSEKSSVVQQIVTVEVLNEKTLREVLQDRYDETILHDAQEAWQSARLNQKSFDAYISGFESREKSVNEILYQHMFEWEMPRLQNLRVSEEELQELPLSRQVRDAMVQAMAREEKEVNLPEPFDEFSRALRAADTLSNYGVLLELKSQQGEDLPPEIKYAGLLKLMGLDYATGDTSAEKIRAIKDGSAAGAIERGIYKGLPKTEQEAQESLDRMETAIEIFENSPRLNYIATAVDATREILTNNVALPAVQAAVERYIEEGYTADNPEVSINFGYALSDLKQMSGQEGQPQATLSLIERAITQYTDPESTTGDEPEVLDAITKALVYVEAKKQFNELEDRRNRGDVLDEKDSAKLIHLRTLQSHYDSFSKLSYDYLTSTYKAYRIEGLRRMELALRDQQVGDSLHRGMTEESPEE